MPTPKYERVADAIREKIKSGQLKPGDKLPSTAQLIEQHRVSYGSLRAAILILKAERLIEGRPGEGVYVLAPSDSK
jgi:GntR family transcriptional regulator